MSLAMTLMLILIVVSVLFFGVAWLSNGQTKHYVCEGAASTIYNDDRTFYPNAQLGIKLTDTNFLGRTIFDNEPQYEYVLNTLPRSAFDKEVSESDVNLSFSQLTDAVAVGDETNEYRGRTMLYFNNLSRYAGLSRLEESHGLKIGFDFDGFCDEG